VSDVERLVDEAEGESQAAAAYFAAVLLDAQGKRSRAHVLLQRAVSLPVNEVSRSLAAVLLRRHGHEPNDIATAPARRGTRTTGG
jgi:hypothetical protein